MPRTKPLQGGEIWSWPDFSICKMSFSDLPLISDLIETHKCKGSSDGSPCTCRSTSSEQARPFIADKRLRNWQEWMQRRKELHQKLGYLLQRKPGGLVMNSAEEYRTMKEKQTVMEYTRIPEPDAQRGCPGFWKMPLQLKDKSGEDSSCFAVISKQQMCEVPVIEHVGISGGVMTEKDVLPRTRNACASWNQSAYVKERLSEVGYRLEQIDPHEPDFNDLFVKGVSMDKCGRAQPSQQVGFFRPKAEVIDRDLKHNKEHSVLSLSINDFEASPGSDISGTRKVHIIFDYDIVSEKVATEYLTIKNKGTTTVRFSWKVAEKVELFKDIIPEKGQQMCFYFNKNQELITPGQTITFPIWFKTEDPGTYSEFWEFCTKPKVLPPNARLLIALLATATIGNLDQKMEALRDRIDNNVRERRIKEALSSVLSNVPYEKFKPTIYSYNKKEVFEAVNSKFDPLSQQSKYIYNKEVVRELQNFYKSVRRRTDPKCWNYRIDELKILASARQRRDDQLRKVEQGKADAKKASLPKLPKFEGERITFPHFNDGKRISLEEKSDNALQKLVLPHSGKSLTEQLEIILKKLERPTTLQNVEQNKYTQAYLILCTCFNKINDEFESLKEKLGIIKKTYYPKLPKSFVPDLYYKPSRLISERLYEVFDKPPLTEAAGTNKDKPAAEILLDIPFDNCKQRFRKYYDIPDTPPLQPDKGSAKGAAKGGKGGKPDKKDAKGDKKAAEKPDKGGKKGAPEKPVGDSDIDDGYVVNENFDPYAKVYLPTFDVEEEEEGEFDVIYSNMRDVPPAIQRQYKYNMYVIMYHYLDKAVMNIVDMIEMQPREHVPYPVIKEIEEPNYVRRLIDLKGLLMQENMDKLNAKLIVYNYRKNSKMDWKNVEIQRQIRNTTSDSSLWSVLRSYEAKPKLPEGKPISYPMEHYEDDTKIDINDIKVAEMVNVSTSTLDGRLDPNWEDFKDVPLQKDYGENDERDDLETYVERVISEITLQDLVDINPDKSTQKDSDEYVSDEEYFYSEGSGSNFSLDSHNSGDSCICEENCECIEGEENGSGNLADKVCEDTGHLKDGRKSVTIQSA